MIVLYLKDGNWFLQRIWGFPELKEESNKLYMLLHGAWKVIINDLTKAGYKRCPDQEVIVPTEWDEEMETPVEIPVTIANLNLRDFGISDLPTSQHLAILKSINPSKARPATVVRTFNGQEYDTDCVVTQDIKDQYQAGKINIGDIVIVSYCEERQDDAIVMAKIYKSW